MKKNVTLRFKDEKYPPANEGKTHKHQAVLPREKERRKKRENRGAEISSFRPKPGTLQKIPIYERSNLPIMEKI
jgi:hypothetical protein